MDNRGGYKKERGKPRSGTHTGRILHPKQVGHLTRKIPKNTRRQLKTLKNTRNY